jgi:glutamate 5-kinase
MTTGRKEIIKKARRVVVKVGSSVLAGAPLRGGEREGTPLTDIFTRLAEEIHTAKKGGREVVVVSSGAIAMGVKKLATFRGGTVPTNIPERQAVAAAGQSSLMASYDTAFSGFSEQVAQVLLTHDDLANRKRFLNARNTLTTLLRLGIIPVINENDTVAVDELKFGDNDNLSALVTNLIEADLLVMLTDIDGICNKDPKTDPSAKLIPFIEDIDTLGIVWECTPTLYGTGGIATKVDAAKKAAHFGCATVVASHTSQGGQAHEQEALDSLLFEAHREGLHRRRGQDGAFKGREVASAFGDKKGRRHVRCGRGDTLRGP